MTTTERLRPVSVGLVGAGPWARRAHAPALAAASEVRLAGVWSRRPEAALALAERHSVPTFRSYPDLLAACEAVSFAVAPAAQGELALPAAAAGRALLLEKPLAADLAGARRLAAAVAAAGVPSQVALTLRSMTAVHDFLRRTATIEPFAGRAEWISGSALGGVFATTWRKTGGALLDLGPHLIDLMDAALGRVVAVHAHGIAREWTGLLLDHEGGAVSEVSLCITAPVAAPIFRVEVHGRRGAAAIDGLPQDCRLWATLVRDFAATVRNGGNHPLDAGHGLRLQELIDAAGRQLQ